MLRLRPSTPLPRHLPPLCPPPPCLHPLAPSAKGAAGSANAPMFVECAEACVRLPACTRDWCAVERRTPRHTTQSEAGCRSQADMVARWTWLPHTRADREEARLFRRCCDAGRADAARYSRWCRPGGAALAEGVMRRCSIGGPQFGGMHRSELGAQCDSTQLLGATTTHRETGTHLTSTGTTQWKRGTLSPSTCARFTQASSRGRLAAFSPCTQQSVSAVSIVVHGTCVVLWCYRQPVGRTSLGWHER